VFLQAVAMDGCAIRLGHDLVGKRRFLQPADVHFLYFAA
jgi:hypothetical protein